jgi:CTP:molybdopterin cytidylyltransferase MocA
LIVAVVLAAGAGRRLGGVAKALLEVDRETYLQRIIATAGVSDVVVVVGPPFADEVAAAARALGARVVVNPAPERGMASSVALGFAALDHGTHAWLWPVDHPHVRRATLDQLIATIGDADVAQPRFHDRGGHPPLVARSLWSQLAGCGEGGARAIFATAKMVKVEVADRGVVADVDTPADLVAKVVG